MKIQRLLLILALFNLGLLVFQLTRLSPVKAADDKILRGQGIEIVDGNGRLRAQLKVEPANATYKMPDGTTGYPETVIFRLITADGKPRVKLTTSDRASGLMLLGETDTTHTILQADRAKTSLKLRDDERTEQLIKPWRPRKPR